MKVGPTYPITWQVEISLSSPHLQRSPWRSPRWSLSALPAGCASAPGPEIGFPCGPSTDKPSTKSTSKDFVKFYQSVHFLVPKLLEKKSKGQNGIVDSVWFSKTRDLHLCATLLWEEMIKNLSLKIKEGACKTMESRWCMFVLRQRSPQSGQPHFEQW